MKLLITGASGYIGAMLADQFACRPDVESIFLIDKEPFSPLLQDHPNKNKIIFVQDNLANDTWQEKARQFMPEVIIHTAWNIRQIYGNPALQWKYNVEAADKVFDLAFSLSSVKKLIHFSTVASYGSFKENEVDHFFTEAEPFRKSGYLYAEEKKIVEERLKTKYDFSKYNFEKEGRVLPQVVILRPAAITGPRGRNARIRFGLQAALAGTLKGQRSILFNVISLWVAWVPVTPKWVRQYIHEDDVNDIVQLLTFQNIKNGYDVFNISPPGRPVFGEDMAKAVKKRMLPIYPWMVRLAFFWVWHLTRGKIPTSPGSWKGYSYPIVVDGSKLTKEYGYAYKYPSKEAFVNLEGRYVNNLSK